MTKLGEIYKCEVCGNIVEVLNIGAGELVCCEKPMKLQEENTVDATTEKHVPIIKENRVTVGSVKHPMEEEHYIEWIEATSEGGEVCKKFLSPGDKPEAALCFSCAARKNLLGTRIGEEYEILKNHFPDLPIIGFYGYGEFSPIKPRSRPRFHNVSFVCLLLGLE